MIKCAIILLLSSLQVSLAEEHKFWARITYYNPSETGGYKVAAPNIKRNKQGYGIAAHPHFKFFTKLRIPSLKNLLDSDDTFVIIDRGSAVSSKKASKGKAYVFDVFVNKTGKDFNNFVKKMPTWAWVIINK